MKIILSALLVLSFAGCAGMQKQANIAKAMESYQFNQPASTVYEAAEGKFARMLTPLTKVKDFEGVSGWIESMVDPKMPNAKSRNRFRVVVSAEGKDKSALKVYREDEYYQVSKWSGDVKSLRAGIHEYNVLQALDPAKAQEIDAAASAK